MVEEAIAARIEIRGVVVSPTLDTNDRGRALHATLTRHGPVVDASDAELTELAATEHPQGVLAVVALRHWSLDDIPTDKEAVIVVLDAVQDPGNVGTLVRTAWALGARGVVTLPGTAEIGNPKTLRSTMGAAFRFPVVAADPETVLEWLRARHVRVVAAGAGGTPLPRHDRGKPLALVLGNEGQGGRSAVAVAASQRVTIPMIPAAESLNVAVAGGILLYEVLRGA